MAENEQIRAPSVLRDTERTFFYATREATRYDQTIELVAPLYRDLHKTVLDLAIERLCTVNSPSSPVALDIGCGTGAEAVPLLTSLPSLRLIGIDLCQQMLTEFDRKCRAKHIALDRYELRPIDILLPDASSSIRTALRNSYNTEAVQLALSAFTFHHFTPSERLRAFKSVFDLVESGGTFLFADLFNFVGESKWLTQTVQNWELSWITTNFDNMIDQAVNHSEKEKLRLLQNEWRNHYLHENKLAGINQQLAELKQVGFVDLAVPFRYWQVGLIFAVKP